MANGIQNKGVKLEISTALPQNADLTAVQFAALTYVEICCVSELPEFGQETEWLSEHCISGEEIVGIGAGTGMEIDIPYFYMSGCAGQSFLRTQGLSPTLNAYAIRKVYPDATSPATPTTVYSRVRIGAWNDGGGGVDDFITHTASAKIVQNPVFVAPAPI